MNKNIWVVVGLVVLAALAWFLFSGDYVNGPTVGDDTENTEEVMENGDETDEVPTGDTEDEEGDTGSTVITYTDSGFSPSELVVEAGTEVTFVNNSSGSFWPASAIHPTHTVYPGSNISLCGTAEALSAFDACGSIAAGSSYSFTFDEVGSWNYHNHLQVSQTGRVVVQ